MYSLEEMRAMQAASWIQILNSAVMTSGLTLKIEGEDPVTIKSDKPQVKDIYDGGCWMSVYFNCGVLRVNKDDYHKLKEWLSESTFFEGRKLYGPSSVTFTKTSGDFDGYTETAGEALQKSRTFFKRSGTRPLTYG